jgi:hypothetical protein
MKNVSDEICRENQNTDYMFNNLFSPENPFVCEIIWTSIVQTDRPQTKKKVYSQKNGAVSKVNRKFISHLTRVKRTPSAATTVHVSHVLPAVRFSCLLRGHGANLQDGVAAGNGFLCAPF